MTDDNDILNRIVAYELNELTEGEIIDLFQEMVDTGLAWSLQGSYGRTANALIDEGVISPPIN